MPVPRGQNGTMSPMPTRSDRDNPVADNSCVAVAFNVSIVSESCFHKYVMMMVWSGFSWFSDSGFGAGVINVALRCE